MNTRKFTLFFFILLLLMTTLSVSYGAKAPQYLEEAEKLNVLSIFKGTDKGFQLDRPPTRIEAGIIFVRLVGGEEEALTNKYPHPFTDVPKWGQDYVGFLYKHKLTKGINESKFGSRKIVKSSEYMTMALRSIGYHDEGVDFKWRKSLDKALELELVDEEFFQDLSNTQFLRDHVVKISYDLLKQPVKGSTATLAEKLVAYGTFTQEILDEMEKVGLEEPQTTDSAIESTSDGALE
ncbi:MAG: hypothetical protein RBS51_02670 [Anaerovoracaceae bacterium]|jgi:hypothetical protein|nr:hypothetical protein [Anaerovoracaceae bacterium]